MLYVVHVAIDAARHDEWLSWMRDVHLPDVMATGCFSDATIARDEPADADSRVAYRFVYRAHSAEAFDRYTAEFAPALQADHTSRYEGAFVAHRELFPIVDRF